MSNPIAAALCAGTFALCSVSAQADEGDKNVASGSPQQDKATKKGIEDAKSKKAPQPLPIKARDVGDFWTPRERAMVNATDPRYLPKGKETAKPAPAAE